MVEIILWAKDTIKVDAASPDPAPVQRALPKVAGESGSS
jgi:hypothetical protein